jgi:hypothetical protein
MTNTIKLKRSTAAGSVPSTSDIGLGETAHNLTDRKMYGSTGSAVVRLDGAYVSASAPSNPVEGDAWYDTVNNKLKAHNGAAFVEVGIQTVALTNWAITETSGNLYFATGGVNKMKLDTSGNLTTTGTHTALGTIT